VEVQKNLSSTQILELLEFLTEKMTVEKTLIPLKAVVRGIKSPDIINHLHSYITETLTPSLRSQVRGKHTPDEIFEVYYLLLELSDSLTIKLYDRKFVKQAVRQCEKFATHFAVPFPSIPKVDLVTMYTAVQRSRRIINKGRKESIKSLQAKSRIRIGTVYVFR
jgi:hypothetical protein